MYENNDNSNNQSEFEIKNDNEFEMLKSLFLLNLKNKQTLSETDKQLVSYYELEDELSELKELADINNNLNANLNTDSNAMSGLAYSDDEHECIKRRASIRRVIDKVRGKVNILFDSIGQSVELMSAQRSGEVLGYSSDSDITTESISLAGRSDKNISLEIEYSGDISFITIVGGENLEPTKNYTLVCFLEKLEILNDVATFTADDCPSRLEIDSYITNMFRTSDKILLIF